MPLAGWDFSWFEGRASEERPPWGYAGLLGERMARAKVALDVQTGGGEVVASIPKPPARLAATEAWPPNAIVAQRNLDPMGGRVARAAEDTLPFRDGTFDLVTSRHPVVAAWPEISRVLAPGGTYFSQQVGAGSNQELIDFMMGPQPVSQARSPRRAVEQAEATGLEVVDLREAALRVEFGDVGAVVHFLRKVLWTVPDFSAERYRERLLQLHQRIQAEGPFVAHSYRFLIEARKREPG
ncbi:class I SAM-dependent methyltransferase [Amycolatopsis acidicola]|uniref:Class I SAM-dependent methyltransferase n=2 Tax=Amycolatopsis acidicola TaxID=2596893 RepID=A0A5N0V0C7_9PSEU|nr:class I SAM-dependent methyltransferase [Amycolatopsis acidicola]